MVRKFLCWFFGHRIWREREGSYRRCEQSGRVGWIMEPSPVCLRCGCELKWPESVK